MSAVLRAGEIASAFLTLGATSYGGPAIMGVMQAELQEKRQWVSRARFVEGLALVNMLPGATATQLGIFLGYVRGGWWGAAAAIFTPLGIAAILVLAGGAGLFLFHSRGLGAIVVAASAAVLALLPGIWWSTLGPGPAVPGGVAPSRSEPSPWAAAWR